MATIKDIARETGFSITTVSRALNNYSDVNINTKKIIFEAAKKLHYVPNRAAQNLVKKTNNTLAFILSGLEKEGGKDNIVYRLLSGMYSFANTIDYDVALYTTDSAHQKQKSYLSFCKEHNISGVIMTGMRLDDPYLNEVIDSGMPCVLVDIDLVDETKNVACITIHNEQAAKEAVECLIKYGHKNIAMIKGRDNADVSRKRYNGYVKALEEHGIPMRKSLVYVGDFLENKAYEQTQIIMEHHPEVSAIFCASDMMALGSIKAVWDCGKKVPEDISIMGFDNIPFAEYLNPPLATVQQDFYLMGYYAGKQLYNMIQGDYDNNKIYISHKVLARGTISMI